MTTMKVVVTVKKELAESESDYSSDHSEDSNADSADLTSSSISANGDSVMPISFTNFDGVHTGVPTRTTPTLTPTTLRNIEQTFIELQRETERAEPHHNEAGFVPPVVEPINQALSGKTLLYSKDWSGGSTVITSNNSNSSQSSQSSLSNSTQVMNARPTVVSNAMSLMQPLAMQSPRRNVGGRRPAKSSGISPEEEERRRVRRERNKLAAARCRKRRLDHTNELQIETEGLEQKRQHLQNEIKTLQQQKEELSFLLQAHNACCRLVNPAAASPPPSPPDIKPVLYTQDNSQRQHKVVVEKRKPPRPSSLPVTAAPVRPSVAVLEVAGVPITTPSSGIPFNFESLMDGGTGLTPVGSTGLTPMIPSCSSQQRSNSMDLASPDTTYPTKLVSL